MAERQITEVVCDICGEKADGQWFVSEHMNGSAGTDYFPIDFCKKHMSDFALTYRLSDKERYLPFHRYLDMKQEEREELVADFKRFLEEEEGEFY